MSGRGLYIVLLALLIPASGLATHNRAGEITLTYVADNTYEILIQTFTYARSAADRNELEVQWDDGTITIAPRVSKLQLPDFYFWNKYVTTHTFPGPGTYTIVVQDPNRNFGVLNIPNSVNVIFSIKTTITINSAFGKNNTPVLLNKPIDKAALGQIFVHNPAAFDTDGDSISYKLAVCTEENGQPIENYSLPLASDTLYIDHITGDLVWDAPVDTGIYNIAIEIEEWRDGIKIGSIARDMQIDVYNTNNRPPVIMPLQDFCIKAGDTLEYTIMSEDPDGDYVRQYATGGPFEFDESPATFDSILTGRGFAVSLFRWETSCTYVRNQPYNIIIKAEDQHPQLKLVDISNFKITVIGPAPENVRAQAGSNSIKLVWSPSSCGNIEGYEIYRRENAINYVPDSCSPGIPPSTGYELIGFNDHHQDTVFIDMNEPAELLQGTEYCYMIVAIFKNGARGYPSREVCAVLIPGTPSMLQASVIDVSPSGSVYLSWAKPKDLDTIPATGPYEYRLYRSASSTGSNFQLIYVDTTADLLDTFYVDNPVNTEIFPYSYTLDLFNIYPDSTVLIGREQETVSTTWLEILSSDNTNRLNINKNAPWVNYEYSIYRKLPMGLTYDSLTTIKVNTYSDGGLKNRETYCYQVVTRGWRLLDSVQYYSENISHINCGTPLDTVPPCPPSLTAWQNCDSLYNKLEWTNPNNYCADDVVKYRIYYSTLEGGNWNLIDSTMSPVDTTYIHDPRDFPDLPETLAGCYVVSAVDSFNNESAFSNLSCVSNCINYSLPNVFSPNGDNINDYFRPNNYSFVEKVNMRIFNRWGNLVFKTEDPDINWNGKHMSSNKIVPPGVYYYICDLYDPVSDVVIKSLVGFVYLFSEQGETNPPANQ